MNARSDSNMALPALQTQGRFLPIGTKLALVIVVVLVVASFVTATGLSRSAKRELIAAKTTGAEMVLDLFALMVASALDFADTEAVQQSVDNLFTNRDIVLAAVWTAGGATPLIAEQRGSEERAPRTTRPPARNVMRIAPDRIELTRPIVNVEGAVIGVAEVHFTLARVNSEYLATRERIVATVTLLAAGIAILVLGFARWQLVGPLNHLVRATKRLEAGELARVRVRANDEIGRVALAFNAMAAVIVDRAERLASANQRVQQLLDNMQQAILVFRSGGVLEAERSRQTELFFGAADGGAATVQQVLYPEHGANVEAEAFEEWLQIVFDAPPEAWVELVELAPPKIARRGPVHGEQLLKLEFRPIVEAGRIAKIMLLATDETEKSRLEREVKSKAEEHSRQMTAMRRLVAGGGQLLVTMLEASRAGIETCSALLSREDAGRSEFEAAFRHVHTIKGEARVLDLTSLERAAAQLESHLAGLRPSMRAGGALTREDREEIGARLAAMRTALELAADLLVRASPIGAAILDQVTVRRRDVAALQTLAGNHGRELERLVERLASRPFGENTLFLSDSVPIWAERLGKRAALQVEGGDVPIPPALAEVLPGVLTHLARNAIAHGIEAAEARELAHKPEVGCISMSAAVSPDDSLHIVVTDDGRGLDLAALQREALARGLSHPALESGELPFLDGLSTFAQSGELAGRGVGLSAVRADLGRVGFGIRIERSEVGTRFRISPLPEAARELHPQPARVASRSGVRKSWPVRSS